MTKEKLILAYSGGLDTSVAIPWLIEKNYEVIAVILDVGQSGKDMKMLQAKALQVGASQALVVETQAEFAQNYVAPVILANALYEGEYPLVSALSRPLIIKKLVEIAHKLAATTIAHGSTGKGNDQVRFEVAIHALDPNLKIEAPIRDFHWSREEEIDYAKAHNVPIPIGKASPYSIDENLWGRANEAGILENPWNEAPADAFSLTSTPEDAPEQPRFVELFFKHGLPVKMDGESLSLAALITKLNKIAGAHGIGRIDKIENRLVGIKSREIYEAPAAAVIMAAHKDLEDLTLERDIAHFKPTIENKLTNLIYDGLWFSPLFDALMAFINASQVVVNGTVKVKLYKGHVFVVARKSMENSLYNEELATYTAADSFDQIAAQGFIKLWSLPTMVYEQVNHVNSTKLESDYE